MWYQEKEYPKQREDQVQRPKGMSTFDVFKEQFGSQCDRSEMNMGESGYGYQRHCGSR